MAIHHQINQDAGVLVADVRGAPSVEEIVAQFKAGMANPEIEACRGALVDLRNADALEFSIMDVDYLAQLTQPTPTSAARLALVASSETNVGLCALYQRYVAVGERVEIFTELAEAWTWLKNGDGGPAAARADA